LACLSRRERCETQVASIVNSDVVQRDFPSRIRWFLVLITIACIGLALRFWVLQIVRGDDYFRYAARNSFKAREIAAPRGIIFDAGGRRIADVRPSFDVVLRPDRIRRPPPGKRDLPPRPGEPIDIRTIARRLSAYLDVPREVIEERYYSASGRTRHRAVLVKGDVPRDDIAVIEAHRIELPGVDIQVSQKRTYPYGKLFAHLIGYLGEVHPDDLARLRKRYAPIFGEDYYEMGDFIGKYGIEKQFEAAMKGHDGLYYVQEDASGRVVTAFDHANPDDEAHAKAMLAYLSKRRRAAVAGHDIDLTIELELQKLAAEKLEGHVGTVVALEPDTGRVLAMVNAPSFDPEIFARGISHAQWRLLREDPAHPLEDKALRGQYPPGSTFKMIPAAAALMEGILTPDATIYCPGSIRVGKRRFRCHRAAGHGSVDLAEALIRSCDVYFYTVGSRLGIDRLAEYARGFGLGRRTGIGLNEEKNGLIPTKEWKRRVFKQPWVVGDTVSAAIGQGFDLVTPIQLARMTAAIANGGHLMKPYVVERVRREDGRVLREYAPREVGRLPVTPEVLETIREAMLGVVQSPHGTARRSRIKGILMAGKTGTAQVVRQDVQDLDKNDDRYKDHALFVGFAPYADPRIAVAVIIEHGGHGGAVAAPIARDVIAYYLRERGFIGGKSPSSPTTSLARSDALLPSAPDEGQ